MTDSNEVFDHSKGSNPLRVLRNRNFALLFSAGATSSIGSSLGSVALTWLVFAQTNSAPAVAYLGVSSIVAQLIFSLFAGTLSDRYNRRLIMIFSDVVRAVSLSVLVLMLYLAGFNLLLVLAVAFIVGASFTLFYPAERAFMPSLIRKDEVADANGLVMVTNSLFQATANAAGGAMVVAVGALATIGLNSLTFLVSALFIASILVGRRIGSTSGATNPPRGSFLSDTVDGIKFLARWRGLFYLTLSAGFANFFFTMMTTFIVVFTSRALSGGAEVYGILLSLLALGFAPGAILVGRTNAVGHAGWVWGFSSLAAGGAALLLAFSSNLPTAAAAVFLLGLALGYGNTTWLSVVQLIVPTEMQGRYFSVDQLGSFAVIPLGQIVGAFLIQAMGVQFEYVVASAGVVVASALFFMSREMRGLRYVEPTSQT